MQVVKQKEILGLTFAILYVFFLMNAFLFIPMGLAWITGTDGLGFVFFFLFLILILICQSLYQSKKSLDWPVVEGVVIENEYFQGIRKSEASLHLVYQYTVYNKTFTNRTISMTEKPSIASVVLEKSKQYAKGSKVKVFYDRLNPKKSALEPGVAKGSYIVAIAFALGSAVSFYFAFKNWQGIPPDRLAIIVNFFKSKI